LVTGVDEKATVAQEAIRLRDEAQKYKGSKTRLDLRKQTLKERPYDDQIMMMSLSTLLPKDVAYFKMMKEEIRWKRMGKPPLN